MPSSTGLTSSSSSSSSSSSNSSHNYNYQKKNNNNNNDHGNIHNHNPKFPTLQLSVLAICRIAEPIALTSIFPYAYPMVKWFRVGDDHSAAFLTGVLVSSFSLAEALSGVFWGGFSDRVGRKPVLLFGCFGTMLSMLMVGFATNFWFALFARCLGGILNGNIGVIQTMVGELVQDPVHEARAFAIMPFVWTLGSIAGPALAGLTADSPLFPTLPYLLPNLVCAALLLVSIIVGYLMLEETLGLDDHHGHPHGHHHYAQEAEAPLIATSGAMDPGTDLRAESYGTFNRVDIQQDSSWVVNEDGSSPLPSPALSRPSSPSTALVPKQEPKRQQQQQQAQQQQKQKESVFTYRVLMPIIALGIFCYHSMAYDSLLPIFLQDARPTAAGDAEATTGVSIFDFAGGLGMSTQQVGIIMSVNGLIALFVQGVVFPVVADRLGVWRVFQLVTIFHPLVFIAVPFLVILPASQLLTGIYACLALRNLFNILAYPVLLILIKQSCEPRHLGKINGLGASVGAAARCIAPPVTGLVYSAGAESLGFSGFAWWAGGLVALVGSLQVFSFRKDPTHKRRSAAVTVRVPCARTPAKDVVHIFVKETVEEV